MFYSAVPNGAVLCATGDEGCAAYVPDVEISKLKITGMKPGVPDLVLAWPGGFGMVEVKSEGGRMSPDQKDVHAALTKLGVCAWPSAGLFRIWWRRWRWVGRAESVAGDCVIELPAGGQVRVHPCGPIVGFRCV